MSASTARTSSISPSACAAVARTRGCASASVRDTGATTDRVAAFAERPDDVAPHLPVRIGQRRHQPGHGGSGRDVVVEQAKRDGGVTSHGGGRVGQRGHQRRDGEPTDARQRPRGFLRRRAEAHDRLGAEAVV